MSNIQTVRDAVADCLAKAEKMYGVDMSKVQVRFDLKGRAAGMAGAKGLRSNPTYYLRFNTTMINGEGYAHVLNDTVPHEVAHMVGFLNGRWGGHSSQWRNACIALGGSGKTYHSEEVVYAKGKTYEYTCTQGTQQRFSEQRHNKIQRGTSYSLKRGGTINNLCEYQVVGISGRPVNTTPKPAAPVQAPVQAPVAATAPKPKGSKADLIRAAILRCKTLDFDRSVAVAYGVEDLGMSRTLARTYVNNNWDKVTA